VDEALPDHRLNIRTSRSWRRDAELGARVPYFPGLEVRPLNAPSHSAGSGTHASSAITARTIRRPYSAIRGKVCR
jgi:hypothetical protein